MRRGKGSGISLVLSANNYGALTSLLELSPSDVVPESSQYIGTAHRSLPVDAASNAGQDLPAVEHYNHPSVLHEALGELQYKEIWLHLIRGRSESNHLKL